MYDCAKFARNIRLRQVRSYILTSTPIVRNSKVYAIYKLRCSVLSRNFKLGEAIRHSFGRVRNFNAFRVTASTLSLYRAVEFHAEIIYEPRTLSVTLSFTSFQRGTADVYRSLLPSARFSGLSSLHKAVVHIEDIRSPHVAVRNSVFMLRWLALSQESWYSEWDKPAGYRVANVHAPILWLLFSL